MKILMVTGTDTGVGKTVATAALAARWQHEGLRVGVYKAVQTGIPATGSGPEPADISEVHRLAGEDVVVREGIRLPLPLAPVPAARDAGVALPPLSEHVATIRDLASSVDIVLVEGSGGLLVELTAAGETLADLCAAVDGELILVARPDLGTLNHTLLTLEAAHARGLPLDGVLLGSWPEDPGILHATNEEYLRHRCATTSTPWLGRIPGRAGSLSGRRFRAGAVHWLCPEVTTAS
ncbi:MULTISPECIES: dethiobiotin synthase [Micrococcaceae]|uniref:dethiobiotin synthase n=1 Tax=Micrococcaceae TaxID=1268 RepID=UPI000BB69FB0|nr:dethiobiotin synthase [Glutamicibacter sp. BW78]PCC25142.1 dethiobiotin synthase [Glutamicibacter sp. BW78]